MMKQLPTVLSTYDHFNILTPLGGGQLGRMMIEAGNRIGVRVAILDPGNRIVSAVGSI